MAMTRREAHTLVHILNGPIARVIKCPFCDGCTHTFRKGPRIVPLTWGELAILKAKVVDHMFAEHADRMNSNV